MARTELSADGCSSARTVAFAMTAGPTTPNGRTLRRVHSTARSRGLRPERWEMAGTASEPQT